MSLFEFLRRHLSMPDKVLVVFYCVTKMSELTKKQSSHTWQPGFKFQGLESTFSLAVTLCSVLWNRSHNAVWRKQSWPFFPYDKNSDICSTTPCVMFSLNVQITQPYCPCCQFCHPFQIPSYLPTCLLPLCLLAFTTCFAIYMHVVLMRRMSSQLDKVSPLSQSTKLSGVSCGRILFEFGVGLIWQSQTPWRYFKISPVSCVWYFPLIGYNYQLWPISEKMSSQEECCWPIIAIQLWDRSQKIPHHAHVCL